MRASHSEADSTLNAYTIAKAVRSVRWTQCVCVALFCSTSTGANAALGTWVLQEECTATLLVQGRDIQFQFQFNLLSTNKIISYRKGRAIERDATSQQPDSGNAPTPLSRPPWCVAWQRGPRG